MPHLAYLLITLVAASGCSTGQPKLVTPASGYPYAWVELTIWDSDQTIASSIGHRECEVSASWSDQADTPDSFALSHEIPSQPVRNGARIPVPLDNSQITVLCYATSGEAQRQSRVITDDLVAGTVLPVQYDGNRIYVGGRHQATSLTRTRSFFEERLWRIEEKLRERERQLRENLRS